VPFGPVVDQEESDWPLVCSRVAEAVASGEADEGIVCCWTGTGASIAANKVPGIRAALVHDAETALGARIWNHANVLALSLRATPIPVMREILEAWYGTPLPRAKPRASGTCSRSRAFGSWRRSTVATAWDERRLRRLQQTLRPTSSNSCIHDTRRTIIAIFCNNRGEVRPFTQSVTNEVRQVKQ
jgi:RpiB/LacA/LacB family sugar-phosphate isomerase